MLRRSYFAYLYLHHGFLQSNSNSLKCLNYQILQHSCRQYSSTTSTIKKVANENESYLSEKEYLVKIKDDPDVFGSSTTSVEEDIDSDDIKEEEFLEKKPPPSSRLRTKQYADIIKSLISKRKIKEAIDVLEVRMLKEDRVKPEGYIYSLLIGACGKVGYTKKAFSLYNQLKKRGLKVHQSIYTSLFNACANSPWPETDGLSRAKHLRNLITEKMCELNDSNYNAMIKAFGRCGDLETAFELVDEMVAKNFPLKAETLNFLLQACITDKDAGFRHALLVWHKFQKKNVLPNIYTFNLMLRCIRDCQLGDLEVTKDVIENLVGNSKFLEDSKELKHLEAGNVDSKTINTSSDSYSSSLATEEKFNLQKIANPDLVDLIDPIVQENRPNLMAKKPHLGNIISLTEVKTPQDRLLLMGGLKGFIENMIQHNCTPDIKTFTQLLDTIPSTLAAEKELLHSLKKFNVKPDIDFFNMLIKKRSMRFDYQSAKEVLTMIGTMKLRPDLITYGVLALGCKTKAEALSLIEDMKSSHYSLNPEILGAMLHQACYHNNFFYVLELMEICIREEIKPNKKFMTTLEEFKKKSKVISNDKENPLSKSKSYQNGYITFKKRYKTWLEEISFDDEEVHPWQQYRQPVETNTENYKDKAQETRFKPRHASAYRKKTSTKVRY